MPELSTHRLVSVRRRGVERTLVVLAPEDRRSYVRLAAALAPVVEPALHEGVIANRVARWSLEPPSLVLRPWRLERQAFATELRALARGHRSLVFADVADCYASIGPSQVRRGLEALEATDVRGVEVFLTETERAGIRGLPVGPEPSAMLANAVLSHVDRALGSLGVAHLRWVDDFVLGVEGPETATEALHRIRLALAEIGLRPNESKTRVLVDPRAFARHPSGMRGREVLVG